MAAGIVIVLAFLAAAFLSVHVSGDVGPDAPERNDRITIVRKCVDKRGAEISGAKIKLLRSHSENRGMAMVEMVNATKTDEEGTFRFRDIRVAIENSDATGNHQALPGDNSPAMGDDGQKVRTRSSQRSAVLWAREADLAAHPF